MKKKKGKRTDGIYLSEWEALVRKLKSPETQRAIDNLYRRMKGGR